MPTAAPALNISPIAVQLPRLTISANNTTGIKSFFMVLSFSLVTGTLSMIPEQTIKNCHKLFYQLNYLSGISSGTDFPQKIRHKKNG